ncbi:hypothetical protein St703_14100 [Sporolactobacillus terrae]|uniref:Transposase IS801/IS1294 domain-containing protein n=1 Tax=Sporolactobacillus terrae TaxID=269673 RepID=A0A5K7WYT7_9BACL|nr:hypothetical protein St703_03350 [Sporolactobacillus terrae]BBN98705.1 hypothetical protein St703_14100 [Sporolactobacillus terrae]
MTPGIIAGLHTFGSQLNFNPHVHMLVSMGGITRKGEWKSYDFIPFKMLRKQWQTVVLKLIRKHLTAKEKENVQPLLQKAYLQNGEGFYVHAPRQRGHVKEQLRYIGRYIRRPAIGLNRIEDYDGHNVTFTYKDKRDNQEKRLTLSVEAFIARLIRHIPDEQFKTIRHYGMYSRKNKKLSKKLLMAWQKVTKRWVIKVNKVLRRRTWRERTIATGNKDPHICPKCGNYYEYKGEVCLEEGRLVIKVALGRTAREYLEEEIRYLNQKTTQIGQKENRAKNKQKNRTVFLPIVS